MSLHILARKDKSDSLVVIRIPRQYLFIFLAALGWSTLEAGQTMIVETRGGEAVATRSTSMERHRVEYWRRE